MLCIGMRGTPPHNFALIIRVADPYSCLHFVQTNVIGQLFLLTDDISLKMEARIAVGTSFAQWLNSITIVGR